MRGVDPREAKLRSKAYPHLPKVPIISLWEYDEEGERGGGVEVLKVL